MCAQLCLTPCDPLDCSPPAFSVPGIVQGRILEWVAISSSKGSSHPRIEPVSPVSSTLAGGFLTTEPPGKSFTHFFKLVFFFFFFWLLLSCKVHYVFWILDSYETYDMQMFSSMLLAGCLFIFVITSFAQNFLFQ